MYYLTAHGDLRSDPRLLLDGARTVISVALNYYPVRFLRNDQYQFAWYAYGADYHEVMRDKLHRLSAYLQSLVPKAAVRVCCDTAPLLERYWAWQAGLGWIGKNTQLIMPHAGSCFFLGEILTTAELEVDRPYPNRCGSCRRCLDACPAGALTAPCRLDARRCLSYLTIEYRGELPAATATQLGNRVYGCDECQRACPHNRWVTPTSEPALQPSAAFLSLDKAQLQHMTESEFRTVFGNSAVRRTKYLGLMRNVHAITEN
jgi:epoxyqueuosine reductase